MVERWPFKPMAVGSIPTEGVFDKFLHKNFISFETKQKKITASTGNRTRATCLEGRYSTTELSTQNNYRQTLPFNWKWILIRVFSQKYFSHITELSWRSWQRVGLIILRSPVRSRSKAIKIPVSLGGYDTRLSPERPGFNSRTGNSFYNVKNFFSQKKIHPPGIEPGTYRVLGGRHNQLDHGCLRYPGIEPGVPRPQRGVVPLY